MSKHLNKVFASMFHVSFLETIFMEPENEKASIDILVEEIDDKGNYQEVNTTVCIKVWNEDMCKQFEVALKQGQGKICIEKQACPFKLALVEKESSCIEESKLTYYVNDEVQNAHFALIEQAECATCVRVVKKQCESASLTITKQLCLLDGQCCKPFDDMQFCVRLYQADGYEKLITLCADNNFCEQVTLATGKYHIAECDCDNYQVRYCFNGEELDQETCFCVCSNVNELVITNQKVAHTQLHLERFIRNVYGELCKPQKESYEMFLVGDDGTHCLCFSEENAYCITLYGLNAGNYQLTAKTDDEGAISYMVNDQGESEQACFTLCEGGCDEVMIIQTLCEESMTSSLRICKYVRSGAARMVRPNKDCCFKVQLTGCGVCDAFYLNANNNFCVDLANLCAGEYCVEEIGCNDCNVSYRINQEKEKTSANFYYDGKHGICVSIINESSKRGSVSISKYFKDEQGNLLVPCKDHVFRATLRSYFLCECFELKPENNYTVCFDNLHFGSYEICEEALCDYETSYQIDCGKLQKHGRFVIDNCLEHEVKIINAPPQIASHSLRISKFMETRLGQLVKPCGEDVFQVWVHNEHFSQTYSLKATNNWQIQLEGLCEDCYQIEEIGCECYDVSYIVNRKHCKEAVVSLKHHNQEVAIINQSVEYATITLKAIVKNCDGEIQEPPCDASFDVLVEGKDTYFEACLNQDNHWQFEIDDVSPGKYRIIQKDNLGYRVSYDIQGCLDSFGKLQVGHQDEGVVIVNEETQCCGNVIVTKYMEDAFGVLQLPPLDRRFSFELCGDDLVQEYTLSAQNDFCVYFDDLYEGEYTILEKKGNFETCYRINGEWVDQASFTLGSEDIYVDIINIVQTLQPIHIRKKICCGNEWKKPDPCDYFHILLKGNKTHEIFELNVDNDFSVSLCDLRKQHYELKELHADGKVRYYVNGNFQEDGYFLYDGEEMFIEIVNEEELAAGIEIRKMISDEYGDLRRPARTERFEVMIESESFKRKLTLCDENDFTVHLFDMPKDHYEIRECGSGGVRYLINDLPYERACIDVGSEDVYVTIISDFCKKGAFHICADQANECPISFYIEGNDLCTMICLDDSNHFQTSLCDLPSGKYRLHGDEDLCFQMEDQCFENEVCIDLQGEEVEICVWRKEKKCVALHVHKWLQEDGEWKVPNADACYEMVLCSEIWQENFQLSAANDFCASFMLEAGNYEVMEMNEKASYRINQGEISDKACFEVREEDLVIDVINEAPTALLQLCAQVQDCDGSIHTPQGDLGFIVEITRQEKCIKRIVLDHENHWESSLELPCASYEITQLPHMEFSKIQYQIEEDLCEMACICLNQDSCIALINVSCCEKGSVEISKLVKEDGSYHYPSESSSFYVCLIGEQETIRTLLDANNGFYACISHLPSGSYEVVEEEADEQTTYIVNNALPSKRGIVQVAQNANTVHIINEPKQKVGSITLTKRMRKDGQLRLPQPNESFDFLITRVGYREMVSLTAENEWTMTLSDLAMGDYVIREINTDADVSYVIDGGSEVHRGVVHVDGSEHQVQIINEEKETLHALTLRKYVRDQSGKLVTPPSDLLVRLRVTSPNFHEIVTLSEENQWQIVLKHLVAGCYVVDELDSKTQVSYIVDQGSEKNKGVVEVKNDMHHIDVINAYDIQNKGSICIEKFIRDQQGLRRPTGEFTALVNLHKQGFQKVITLDQQNGWRSEVSNLADGLYALDEIATKHKVSYIINGGQEVTQASVSVEGNMNHVIMIDEQQMNESSLTISKQIRTPRGNLVSPDPQESFEIEVIGEESRQTITLNKQNNWHQTLNRLASGRYTIMESNEQDYEVSYLVDDAEESNEATLGLDGGNHRVQILNSRKQDQGSLTLAKFMRNGDGSLMVPADGDEFVVRVANAESERLVTLNNGNNFEAAINDLPNGEYSILEIQNMAYLTTYRINGGPQLASASVAMFGGVEHHVDVINELRGNRNTIEVFKYMLDSDGNYLPPTAPAVYSFTITGLDNDVSETYELNVENSWHQSLRTLPSGRYQVQENGNSPYGVKYLINSAQLMDEAIFEAVAGSTQVIGIINTQTSDGLGTLSISKRIRDVNKALILPQNNEVFTVVLSGKEYNQTITLESSNNYQFTVFDLPFGSYQIAEVTSDYAVSYRANDGSESASGMIEINGTALNTMLVINTPIAAMVHETTSAIKVILA